MIASKPLMLITLSACILGLSALGSEKYPVPRPYKSSGPLTTVVDLNTGEYETTGVANVSHMGRTTIYTTGVMDPETFTVFSQNGTATAANGDQHFWELQGGALVITGGTGRFKGATGSLSLKGELEDLAVVIDLKTMTMTMTYSATIEGTIIY